MRRTKSQTQGQPGKAWCSRHDDGRGAWVPREEFGPYGERSIQAYCRACRNEYMRRWRREGLPAKQRETYDAQQAQAEGPMAALARKYANR